MANFFYFIGNNSYLSGFNFAFHSLLKSACVFDFFIISNTFSIQDSLYIFLSVFFNMDLFRKID